MNPLFVIGGYVFDAFEASLYPVESSIHLDKLRVHFLKAVLGHDGQAFDLPVDLLIEGGKLLIHFFKTLVYALKTFGHIGLHRCHFRSKGIDFFQHEGKCRLFVFHIQQLYYFAEMHTSNYTTKNSYFLHLAGLYRILEAIVPYFGAHDLEGEGGDADFLSEIVDDAADIGAARAGNLDAHDGKAFALALFEKPDP